MRMKLTDEPRGLVVLFFPKLQDPQWPIWPPLDLYAIATALMYRGYEVCLIDDRVDPEADEKLARDLPQALFIGISTKLADQLRNTLKHVQRFKAMCPDVPVVVGGWFPALFPESLFESPHVDVVVSGPGDFSAPEIADRLLAGHDLAGIDGVLFRDGERVVRNVPAHLPDIRKTHRVPWSVVGIARYLHPHGWINCFSSRGCPGECTFCSIYCLDPKRWTALEADRVVQDMEELVALGAQAVRFVDSDFCADVGRVEAISRLILQRGLKVRWEILARYFNLRSMTDEQLRLMRLAGCTEIETGIETGSQRLSDLVRKKVDVEEVPATVRRFVAAGIRLKINIMFGMPTETPEDLAQSLRLTLQLAELGDNAVYFQLFRYTPVPGGTKAADAVWTKTTAEHDGTTDLTLQELADFPVIDFEPDRMFWVTREHERVVKRVHYFYGPLAFIPGSFRDYPGRPIWSRFLRLLRPLARWRIAHYRFELPFEKWLNDRFGYPLPHASDAGVGPHADVLPPPMGDSIDFRPPLEPVARKMDAAVHLRKPAVGTAAEGSVPAAVGDAVRA